MPSKTMSEGASYLFLMFLRARPRDDLHFSLTLEIPAHFETRKRGSEPCFRGSKCEKWAFSGPIF